MESERTMTPPGAEGFKSPVSGSNATNNTETAVAVENQNEAIKPEERGRSWLSSHSGAIKENLTKLMGLEPSDTTDFPYPIIRGAIGGITAVTLWAANYAPEAFHSQLQLDDPRYTIGTLVMMAGTFIAGAGPEIVHGIKDKFSGY